MGVLAGRFGKRKLKNDNVHAIVGVGWTPENT